MSAEAVAYATLSGASTVIAIVSTRIYPDVAPERGPLPAIAMTRMQTEYANTIHGGPPVASLVHLDVWCMADTRGHADALGDAVELALSQAGFFIEDRRFEYDPESFPIRSSVLSVGYWQ